MKSNPLRCSHPLRNLALHSLLLASLVLQAGCTTTRAPQNKAITHVVEGGGYRPTRGWETQQSGANTVLLAFSGGGVRAAALSYGVMQELRDTLIERDGKTVRLLDEVDVISSVSGGSFTAAYYGLYRERLFQDYEDDFLRQGVQQALIKQLFNPMHWIRSGFKGFNRTEMTIDYYNRIMFDGATFGDMARNGPPFIAINATDLAGGLRFSFSQNMFDLICTDLGSYPVARAVTASSAVPVAFPPVVLENHAGSCDLSDDIRWQQLEQVQPQNSVQTSLVEGMKSYRNAQQRKYIHLVDGGIGDNLGLRTLIDRFETMNQGEIQHLPGNVSGDILVILVNAEVNPDRLIEQTFSAPSVATTMAAVSSAQFSNYNMETMDRFRHLLNEVEQVAEQNKLSSRIYFTQVSFEHAKVKEINRLLNSLPTTLALEDIDVDRLIVAGRLLLRTQPEFQAFKQRHHARLAEGALNEAALCDYYDHPSCAR
jgi:NTE family protein